MAIDHVCGMEADPASAEHVVDHAGRRVGFCSEGCLEQFLVGPAAYLAR